MKNTDALARCDQEIATINEEASKTEMPAWLVALGVNDWEVEKRMIEDGK